MKFFKWGKPPTQREIDIENTLKEATKAAKVADCEKQPNSNISGVPETLVRGCSECIVGLNCPKYKEIQYGGGGERKG